METLFNSRIPLSLNIASNAIYSAETKYSRTTNCDIEILVSHSAKALEIRVTDNLDSFFVYICKLGELEFSKIRSEQNLMVDFESFGMQFIELLRKCSEGVLSRFSAVFKGDEASATLSIVETTTFKQITHITLRFEVPSEASLKQYFADMIRSLREEHNTLLNKISMQKESLMKAEDERRNIEISLNDKVRRLTDRIATLENERNSLMQSKGQVENDGSMMKRDNDRLKEENRTLKIDIERSKEAERRLEREIESQKRQINELEESLSKASDEIDKGNEIMKKLQSELKSIKTSNKTQSQMHSQQEKMIEDLQRTLDLMRKECEDVRKALREKELSCTESEMEKRRLQDELDSLKRVNQSNEKVMDWLHRQVNENQIGVSGKLLPGTKNVLKDILPTPSATASFIGHSSSAAPTVNGSLSHEFMGKKPETPPRKPIPFA